MAMQKPGDINSVETSINKGINDVPVIWSNEFIALFKQIQKT